LRNSTTESLKQSFAPQVQQSFNKVGADKIWKNLITKYNSIPLISKVNPDLTEYVTEQAISGVFKMVEEKEAGIRGNVSQRTTPLLKKVFKQQDLK